MSKLIIILITLCCLFSCGNNCDSEIASDQLKFADSMKVDSRTYYLYTLTTGWNDKAVYFQLYDMQPTLNDCREINIKPIYETVHDDFPDTQYVEKLILQPKQDEMLKIIYTKDLNKGAASVYDVTFTR